MPRVVSLIASATEIVCALGLEDNLVGRSHECDYPESVGRLPVCTGPNFDTQGPSAEIDRQVKGVLEKGLSVYRVDGELLRRLRPDVIVTQSQCEVCAVSGRDVERALGGWTGPPPRVLSLAPNVLADVWADVVLVAEALGIAERGRALVAGLQARAARVGERAGRLSRRPTVACVEWIDPLMAAGNWVPELVEMAGGRNLFGSAGRHAPWMTWDELRAADPEVIAVIPCGLDVPRSAAEMAALTARPGWPGLRAVREGRVYLADGNQYFNRPGPRLVESLEILAELIHPAEFHFGHRGEGWEPFGGAAG
jgi:iron complex transport system substrate-binding protein